MHMHAVPREKAAGGEQFASLWWERVSVAPDLVNRQPVGADRAFIDFAFNDIVRTHDTDVGMMEDKPAANRTALEFAVGHLVELRRGGIAVFREADRRLTEAAPPVGGDVADVDRG